MALATRVEVNGEYINLTDAVKAAMCGGGGGGSVPTFDLTEMGMPAVSFVKEMDWVQADLTKLCEAFDKGVVKLKFTAEMGDALVHTSCVAGAMHIEETNRYLDSALLSGGGAIYLFFIEFDRENNQFRVTASVLGG